MLPLPCWLQFGESLIELVLQLHHIQLDVFPAQFGFHLIDDIGRVRHALIRYLGRIIDSLHAATVMFGLDEFRHRQEVIEIRAIDFVQRIQVCNLFRSVVATVPD